MKQEPVYDAPAVEVPVSPLVTMSSGELIRTILTGIGVGILSAVLMVLMNKFIFGAVLCRPQSVTDCSQAPTYAMIVAMVIGAIAGLVSLARMRVYRPLLIVLAATIALWGLNTVMASVAWYWVLLMAALLFGLVYGLFAWIARIRNFIMAVVVTVVVAVRVLVVLAVVHVGVGVALGQVQPDTEGHQQPRPTPHLTQTSAPPEPITTASSLVQPYVLFSARLLPEPLQLGHGLVAESGRNLAPSQRARNPPQILQVSPHCDPSIHRGLGRQLIQRQAHLLALAFWGIGRWSGEVSSTYEVDRTRFRSSALTQVVFAPNARSTVASRESWASRSASGISESW